jgi:hypothetical protein
MLSREELTGTERMYYVAEIREAVQQRFERQVGRKRTEQLASAVAMSLISAPARVQDYFPELAIRQVADALERYPS